MNKKYIILISIALAIIIAVPIVFASFPSQTQNINETGQYTAPATPTPSPTPSSTPTPVSFSMFFPNGTAFPTSVNANTPISIGESYEAVNGIPVSFPSGCGNPEPSGIIVLQNDGSVPITVNATLENVKAPSDIEFGILCYALPIGDGYSNWLGYGNLASGGTVAVGQYIWLSINIVGFQTDIIPPTSAPNFSFSYSFDISVTATQAS